MLRGGDPVLDDLLELLGGHAGVRGHDDFGQRVFAAGERGLHVALEQRGERLLVLPLGMLRRERLHAVEREEELDIHRLLAQSVPSLSNVAMRSATGTKSGEPAFVTLATKSTMACLAAPSFQEGKRV